MNQKPCTTLVSAEQAKQLHPSFVQSTAKHFETIVKKWEIKGNDVSDYWYRRNVLAAALIQHHLQPQARCLDIGCASGHLCELLCKKGYDVYGIDIVPAMIDMAQKKMRALHVLESHFLLSDGLTFPFRHCSFDFVSALDVMPYIEDQPKYILQLRSLLRPNGLALVSCTNRNSLFIMLVLAGRMFTCKPGRTFWRENRNLLRTGYWSGGFVDHTKAIQARSADALDQAFRQAGFHVIAGFDTYNLRWLDRNPLGRKGASYQTARRWAWNHFGLYKKVL